MAVKERKSVCYFRAVSNHFNLVIASVCSCSCGCVCILSSQQLIETPPSSHPLLFALIAISKPWTRARQAFAAPPRVIEVPSMMVPPMMAEAQVAPLTGQSDSLGLSYLIRAYQVPRLNRSRSVLHGPLITG